MSAPFGRVKSLRWNQRGSRLRKGEREMTNVQKRLAAVLAAFLLVVGCGLMVAMPQKAHADIAAGSTIGAAKQLVLLNKSLSAKDDASFSSRSIYKWYKFVTSGRNSTYKVRVWSDDEEDIDVIVYNSDFGIETHFVTDSAKTRTFEALDRNATYYIRLNRATDGSTRADYRIKVREVITPPEEPASFYAWSKLKRTIRLKYSACDNATGYQVAYKKGSGKWVKRTTTRTTYVFTNLTKSKKYTVRVRPYRTINGKRHYGGWSDTVKLKPNGKKVKYYA